MPNSKHFYGSSRFRGGIDIDETSLSDDANYWKGLAQGSYKHLEKLTDPATAILLIEGFWNKKNTWKTICLMTEKIVNEIEDGKKYLYCISCEYMTKAEICKVDFGHVCITPATQWEPESIDLCEFPLGWATCPPPEFNMDEFMEQLEEQ